MGKPTVSAALTLTVTDADPERIAPLLEQMALLVRAAGGKLDIPDRAAANLPEAVRHSLREAAPPKAALPACAGSIRRREKYLETLRETAETFEACGRQVAATAMQLGVSGQCVYRRLDQVRRLGIRSNGEGARGGAA